MAENLFRKVSLERITSPEQLDKLLVIVKIKGWIALVCILGVTFAIILWSFFGSIPIAATGKGILLDPQGLRAIYSQAEGRVVQILTQTGSEVKKGDNLIVMVNPIYEIQLREELHRIASIKRTISILEEERQFEIKMREEEYNKKQQLDELILKNQKAKLAILEKELATSSFEKKTDLEKEIIEQKTIIQAQLSTMSIFHTNLLLSETNQKLDDANMRLHLQQGNYDILKTKNDALTIKAPDKGRIIELDVELGRQITPRTPLLWIQTPVPEGEVLPFYAFIPIDKGEKIQAGMLAQISFLAIDTQQYGQLLGRVKRVLPYAGSLSDQQLAGIPTRILKGYLEAETTSILVVIDPIIDRATPSGYKWTTPNGPPNKLDPGFIGTARIILEQKKPISYAFPVFKGTRTQPPLKQLE
jgi:HlyD family secretion protein